MQLVDRVRHALGAAGYQAAGGGSPGFLLDETERGHVQLWWGCADGEALPDANDRVMLCADLRIAEAFDVEPGDWITGDGEEIVIRA